MPTWTTILGVAMGSAWLSGVNLYATTATLGLLQHYHLAQLPGELSFLSEWWVIGLSCALYLIEFVADKIPAVDSAWDAVHTFIRVPAGAVLASAAFGDFDPRVRIAAFLLGGGIALTSHGTKAAVRASANLSPEPVSNVVLSLLEDIAVFGSSLVTVFFPIVMIVVVVVFLCVAIWLLPKIVRALRGVAARATAWQR